MDSFARYGLYVVPDGALFDVASSWLGWDSAAGRPVAHPVVTGLPAPVEVLTRTPRKYGFHGTIKPPFRLADGMGFAGFDAAARAFCATRQPVVIPALEVRRLGRFIAITPTAPSVALSDLAATAVAALDAFRAPPAEVELARRRAAGLTDAQEALLRAWGYPYVMDEFRFHMTLTGRTEAPDIVRACLSDHFAPVLPKPFVVDSLAVMGEDADGMFHLVNRYTLSG